MHKKKFCFIIIFLSLCFCWNNIQAEEPNQAVSQEEYSQEDMEVIENMDLLENLDYLEEDLAFLEDYDGLEKDDHEGEKDD